MDALTQLRSRIRTVPDWPKAGVQFRDITPLLADGQAFALLIEQFAQRYRARHVQAVAGLEARGFIVGAALARALGVGFIPIRKQGKLPFATLEESYALEYGEATLQIHTDALEPGQRVLLVDDLIATGGTMLAGAHLLMRLGAELVECAAAIDLPELGGAARLRDEGLLLFALLEFGGH
ncbi:MAG TPA: adenine phosphoribosyltransferase [Burkholderiaceae bacterium]